MSAPGRTWRVRIVHGAIGTYASGPFQCLHGENTGRSELEVFLLQPDFTARGDLSGTCEHTQAQHFQIPIQGVPAAFAATSIKAVARV